MSARGLYAYDWRMGQAPYELIAVPAEPIRIEELPDEVRGAAGILRVSRPFAEALTLQLG